MSISPVGVAMTNPKDIAESETSQDADDVKKVSQQFESILLRQFLSESMKSLLENGPSGQIYGYMLTDSLADSISKGGGLGLCSILQTQLGNTEKNAKP